MIFRIPRPLKHYERSDVLYISEKYQILEFFNSDFLEVTNLVTNDKDKSLKTLYTIFVKSIFKSVFIFVTFVTLSPRRKTYKIRELLPGFLKKTHFSVCHLDLSPPKICHLGINYKQFIIFPVTHHRS